MKKIINKLLAALLATVLLISVFASSALAAESNTAPLNNTDSECSEELVHSLGKSPYEVTSDQKISVSDSKETLIAAIKSPDIFSVNGTITEGKSVSNVTEYFDFSNASKFNAADWAYSAGLITEEEKIDCYCDIIINRNFINETCLNEAFNTIETYKSAKRVSEKLSTKIQEATENPYDSEEDTNSTRSIPLFQRGTYNSTNFEIIYSKNSTTSTDAANVANYLEQIRVSFHNMGFLYPIKETNWLGNSMRHKVYLDPEPDPDGSAAAICARVSVNGKTSASEITYYNFSSFDINSIDDCDSKTKEILTHEYFHAIQFAYNIYYNWFAEACANWASITVSGTCVYLQTQIEDFIQNNLSLSNATYKYGACLFPFAMQISWGGPGIIKVFYETLSTKSMTLSETEFQDTVTEAFEESNSLDTFELVYRRMVAFLCDTSYWFKNASPVLGDIDLDAITTNITIDTQTLIPAITLNSESSVYYGLFFPANYSGNVNIVASFNSPDGYIQLHFKNSTNCTIYTPESIKLSTSQYQSTYTIPSYLLHNNFIVLIVSNTDASNSLQFSIRITPN